MELKFCAMHIKLQAKGIVNGAIRGRETVKHISNEMIQFGREREEFEEDGKEQDWMGFRLIFTIFCFSSTIHRLIPTTCT